MRIALKGSMTGTAKYLDFARCIEQRARAWNSWVWNHDCQDLSSRIDPNCAYRDNQHIVHIPPQRARCCCEALKFNQYEYADYCTPAVSLHRALAARHIGSLRFTSVQFTKQSIVADSQRGAQPPQLLKTSPLSASAEIEPQHILSI
eukprot:s5_g60.t1